MIRMQIDYAQAKISPEELSFLHSVHAISSQLTGYIEQSTPQPPLAQNPFLFPGNLVFCIAGGFARDKLLKTRSNDLDLVIKKRHFQAFVDTFNKVQKFSNFHWSHSSQTTQYLSSGSLSTSPYG